MTNYYPKSCKKLYVRKILIYVFKLGRYGQEPSRYELVIPQKVSHSGEFVSNMIPHHYKLSYYSNRKPSELGPEDMVHYLVPITGEMHHLELSPNHALLSPGAVLETRQSGGDTLIPSMDLRKVRDVQCHFNGRVRNHKGSRVALSTCYGLVCSHLITYMHVFS